MENREAYEPTCRPEPLTLEVVKPALAAWLERWPYFDTAIIDFIAVEIVEIGHAGNVDRILRQKGAPATKETRARFGMNPREKAGEYLLYITEAGRLSGHKPSELMMALANYPWRVDSAQRQRQRGIRAAHALPWAISYAGFECETCAPWDQAIWPVADVPDPSLQQCPKLNCRFNWHGITEREYDVRQSD